MTSLLENTCLVLPLLIFYSCFIKANTIHWSVITKPIVMGEDVILLCQTSSRDLQNYTVIWQCGADERYIAVGNKLADNLGKYLTRKEPNGTALIIHNFSREDAEIQYICSREFQSYRNLLSLGTDYEYHPTKSSTMVQVKLLTEPTCHLEINVTFLQVFPIPHCNVSVFEYDISEELSINTRHHDLWYRVSLSLLYSFNQSQCPGDVNVVMNCKVGSRVHPVINQRFTQHDTSSDSEYQTVLNTKRLKPEINILVIGLLLAVLFLCLAFVISEDHKLKKQEKTYNAI